MMQIRIDVGAQKLRVYQEEELIRTYFVSTASKGVGQMIGSEQTPLGLHKIHQKIGDGCPPNTVFIHRQPTGEIYTSELSARYPERDWILTRIMWLSGKEPAKNQGGSVDTLGRYIYIHGTPETVKMGQPASHGCIRMRNQDVIQLFDLVPLGTEVLIHE
ncbi:MAG TPA: L,D-transpeptidase [Coxiellaceae bacterium]|nr:L,D-transpeptidase [Coxiellaceae bacterium]